MVKNLPAMQENWVGKISWRREWLPTPIFLPGAFHGQRSLAGSGPQRSRQSRVRYDLVTEHTQGVSEIDFSAHPIFLQILESLF